VSKVGVVSISETLRLEMQMVGAPIGVSVLCPSATNTRVNDAERNRPPDLPPEQRTAEAEAWRAGIQAMLTGPGGKEPGEVAAIVVDAVKADRFWVISHGDLRDALAQRFNAILDAVPADREPA
jgi:NAD(P)-dependent dehydrogenase (short-subunit alcohol dehydrogenase family)